MTHESSSEEFKEKLRSLRFGRVPGGSRPSNGRRAKPDPAWERGIPGEQRPGGGVMPVLDPANDFKPIRQKEYGERRREIDARLHQLHNDPNVSKP